LPVRIPTTGGLVKKLGGVLLLVFALAGCNNGGDETPAPTLPAMLNLRGEIILNGKTNVRGGLSDCVGAGTFTDLYAGAPVVISNPAGRPLVIEKIEYGIGTNFYLNQLDQCTFSVRLRGVPRLDNYQLTVGRQDPVPFTFAEAWRYKGLFTIAFPRIAAAVTTTTTAARP
jgi:hypothetical protein